MSSDKSRKRKRVADLSPARSEPPEWENNIIRIAPRRSVARIERIKRPPLISTQARGNLARSARTAQHANGMPSTLSTLLTLCFKS
jgi:hypothetical protein